MANLIADDIDDIDGRDGIGDIVRVAVYNLKFFSIQISGSSLRGCGK